QWLQQNAGFTNDTLGFYEMSLPDKNTAWAVCYDGKRGLLSGRPVLDFTRTTNGGATWIPGKMGTDRTLRFSNISAINGLEAWVAMNKIGVFSPVTGSGFAGGGGIFHTSDGGVTWKHTSPGELFNNNSVPRFVHFKDKNHGIAMGDPNGGYFEVYITNNKGKKWKRVPQEALPAPLANEVGWISGYAAVGNTIWFGTSAGRMYKSVDFGKTWTVHTVDPLPGTAVNEIAFLDDGLTGVTHLRGRGRTFVFSTSDGGLTWTNYFQPANWKNSRVTAVPGTNAFVSTSVHFNPLFTGSAVSYDAGQTWTDIERDAQKAVCRFFDANTGYAGGFFLTGPPFRGGIFKSQIVFEMPSSPDNTIRAGRTSEAAVEQEKMINGNFVKVFPIPARDVINVVLQDAFLNADGTVSIHSLDGKLLQSRKLSGATSMQLNVSKLPAGVYTLRITSKTQMINKLITLAK
ncbi:MAG TPA: T9SS type A sorting domain-containing protein, partial [Flavisolibacter sp.]|nr:T9SS type A sorting domain-containing protein [Flavisolibacter sp.]